jgi:hypothetical protein
MGFQFAETMAGTVEWDAQPGVAHPFSFEVTAAAASTLRHLQDGKAALRGVIHAQPLAQAAETTGTITIRPVGERIIRYELAFTGDDGNAYQLVGQKDIRWRNLVHTFTHLPADIFDGAHRRVGSCRAAFDVQRDGWRFLRSFRPL